MTSQPPLLDQTGTTLPGPQFVPRPGWGGQLKRWFSENTYSLIFRVVVLCALILVARSLWVNLPARTASLTPTPSPTAQEVRGITVTAQRGDGMTNLAARALDLYLAVQSRIIRLDAAQHLFAVDTLARVVCWCAVDVDQEVTFASANIESVIERALALTPAQRAAWERLLR